MTSAPLQALRHHVTGAIERGEAVAITEMPPPIRKPDPPPGRRPFPPAGQQRVRRSVTLTERQLDILHVALSEAACSNIVVSGKLVTHDEYRGINRALALLTPEAA